MVPWSRVIPTGIGGDCRVCTYQYNLYRQIVSGTLCPGIRCIAIGFGEGSGEFPRNANKQTFAESVVRGYHYNTIFVTVRADYPYTSNSGHEASEVIQPFRRLRITYSNILARLPGQELWYGAC